MFSISCSYCERQCPAGLAVEHVLPKSLHPDLELDWDNYLLGCVSCNSAKGANNATRDGHAWPDKDNTLLMLRYRKGGLVDVAPGLAAVEKDKAASLVALLGLDRHPFRDGAPKPTKRDKRWRDRSEIWDTAESAKDGRQVPRRPPQCGGSG